MSAPKQGPILRRSSMPWVMYKRRRVTANATVVIEDALIEVDTTAGAVALTLPLASSVPEGTAFKAVQVAGGNTTRWAPQPADTINGLAAGTAYSFSANSVRSSEVVSDGVSGWQTIDAGVGRNLTVNATINAGSDTVTTPDLGLGSLGAARVMAGFQQAAVDATLTALAAVGNPDGTVTVKGNANATAPVTVAIWVDAR